MIVYIEDTLIENFLVTYLILLIVFCFTKEQKSKLRIVFACIFASIIALLYPLINLSSIPLLLLKTAVGYVITLISYKTKSLKKQIFFFLMFMFVTAIYGGINLMIYFAVYGNFESSKKLPTLVILILLFVISYFLKQCQMKLYSKKQIDNFIYDVVITNNNKQIKTKAYLDTGNVLCDDSKPVVLVNFRMFEKINENFKIQNLLTKKTDGLKNGHYITVKTATSSDNLLAFSVDKLEIKTKDTTKIIANSVFALSKIKITGFDCDVILNSKLMGD